MNLFPILSAAVICLWALFDLRPNLHSYVNHLRPRFLCPHFLPFPLRRSPSVLNSQSLEPIAPRKTRSTPPPPQRVRSVDDEPECSPFANRFSPPVPPFKEVISQVGVRKTAVEVQRQFPSSPLPFQRTHPSLGRHCHLCGHQSSWVRITILLYSHDHSGDGNCRER